MDVIPIYPGCDLDVFWHEAQDKEGNFLNDGTCIWSLYTLKGDLVAGGTVDYVADSDGEYFTTVDASTFGGLRGSHMMTVRLRAGEFDDTRTERVNLTNRPFSGAV